MSERRATRTICDLTYRIDQGAGVGKTRWPGFPSFKGGILAP
jgi:hypothetical protein